MSPTWKRRAGRPLIRSGFRTFSLLTTPLTVSRQAEPRDSPKKAYVLLLRLVIVASCLKVGNGVS